jgi:hypothetical protein
VTMLAGKRALVTGGGQVVVLDGGISCHYL